MVYDVYATDNNLTNVWYRESPTSIFSSKDWDSDGFMVWESFIHDFLLSSN